MRKNTLLLSLSLFSLALGAGMPCAAADAPAAGAPAGGVTKWVTSIFNMLFSPTPEQAAASAENDAPEAAPSGINRHKKKRKKATNHGAPTQPAPDSTPIESAATIERGATPLLLGETAPAPAIPQTAPQEPIAADSGQTTEQPDATKEITPLYSATNQTTHTVRKSVKRRYVDPAEATPIIDGTTQEPIATPPYPQSAPRGVPWHDTADFKYEITPDNIETALHESSHDDILIALKSLGYSEWTNEFQKNLSEDDQAYVILRTMGYLLNNNLGHILLPRDIVHSLEQGHICLDFSGSSEPPTFKINGKTYYSGNGLRYCAREVNDTPEGNARALALTAKAFELARQRIAEKSVPRSSLNISRLESYLPQHTGITALHTNTLGIQTLQTINYVLEHLEDEHLVPSEYTPMVRRVLTDETIITRTICHSLLKGQAEPCPTVVDLETYPSYALTINGNNYTRISWGLGGPTLSYTRVVQKLESILSGQQLHQSLQWFDTLQTTERTQALTAPEAPLSDEENVVDEPTEALAPAPAIAEAATIAEPQPAPTDNHIVPGIEVAPQEAPIILPAVVEPAAVAPTRTTTRRGLCTSLARLPLHFAAKACTGIHRVVETCVKKPLSRGYDRLKPACEWYESHRSCLTPFSLMDMAHTAYRRWRPSAETIRSFDLTSGGADTVTEMHVKVAVARIEKEEAASSQLLDFGQGDVLVNQSNQRANRIAIGYASHTLRLMGIEPTSAITAMLNRDSRARQILAIIGRLNHEGKKVFSAQAIANSLQQGRVIQHSVLTDQSQGICFEIDQRIYRLQNNTVTAIGDWKHSIELLGIKALHTDVNPAQRMTILDGARAEELEKYKRIGVFLLLEDTEQAEAFARQHFTELNAASLCFDRRVLHEPATGITALGLGERMYPVIEKISPPTASLLVAADQGLVVAEEKIGKLATQFALTDVTYHSPLISAISSRLPDNSVSTEEIPNPVSASTPKPQSQKMVPNNTSSVHQQLTNSATGTLSASANTISTPEKSKINGFTLCGGALTLGGALVLLQQLRHQLPLAGKLADQIRLTATEEDLSSPAGKSIYRAYGPRKTPTILAFLGMVAGVAMVAYGAHN